MLTTRKVGSLSRPFFYDKCGFSCAFFRVFCIKKDFIMSKLAVIALGGNALLRDNQAGTIDEQEANAFSTMENLIFLLKDGYNLVITHGNGPQVGNILLRNDAGERVYNLPQMPLDVCVADSQGGIGYMIERMLHNVLTKHGLKREVVSILTQVVVNKDDAAFQNPTKRIGPSYTAEQAEVLKKEKSWFFKADPKHPEKFRRVVPSPEPVSIMNRKVIENLAHSGTIVITCGGGGIPVYIDENKDVRPAEAVIDKDFASSLLAKEIGADELYILTDVPYIYLNYNTSQQKIAEFLDVADAESYLEQGMFGEGSMAPKVKAAIYFVKNGGQKSVITEATQLEDKKIGSRITLHYDNV
jgi:carbamate kinase